MARLQIWLIEAREADVAIIWLQVGVDILSAVFVVLEVLESLAIRDIERLEFNDGLVHSDTLICGRDIDPVVLPKILGICRGDCLSIHRN